MTGGDYLNTLRDPMSGDSSNSAKLPPGILVDPSYPALLKRSARSTIGIDKRF